VIKLKKFRYIKYLLEPLKANNDVGRTELLFAPGIERGIHNRQVLKFQPSVTSRVIFHHLIPLIIIKYLNISVQMSLMIHISGLDNYKCTFNADGIE